MEADVWMRDLALDGANSRRSVGDYMTTVVATVAPTTSVAVADALAIERAVEHLLVARGERLVGILCRCDLWARDGTLPVSVATTRPVISIARSASLADAARAICEHRVGCLPVIEGTRIAEGYPAFCQRCLDAVEVGPLDFDELDWGGPGYA